MKGRPKPTYWRPIDNESLSSYTSFHLHKTQTSFYPFKNLNLITHLVIVFVQKGQVSLSIFLSVNLILICESWHNLVMISEKLIQFEKSLICFKKFNGNDQIAPIFHKLEPNCIYFHKLDQIETKQNLRINLAILAFLDENRNQMTN